MKNFPFLFFFLAAAGQAKLAWKEARKGRPAGYPPRRLAERDLKKKIFRQYCGTRFLHMLFGSSTVLTLAVLAVTTSGAASASFLPHCCREQSFCAEFDCRVRESIPAAVGGGVLRLRGGSAAMVTNDGSFEINYRCSRKWKAAFVHFSFDDGATWSLKPDGVHGACVQSAPCIEVLSSDAAVLCARERSLSVSDHVCTRKCILAAHEHSPNI